MVLIQGLWTWQISTCHIHSYLVTPYFTRYLIQTCSYHQCTICCCICFISSSFILSFFWGVSLLSAQTVVQVIFGLNLLQFVLNICYLLDMLWVWLVLDGFRHRNFDNKPATLSVHKPATEQVQVLADLSRSALCCHSNETHALIANTPTVHN